MMRRKAQRGEPEAFLRACVNHVGSECLEWPFSRVGAGYGSLRVGGVVTIASRYMCTLAHGEPPSPIHEAAHSCGNKPCINPSHLRWALPEENHADRVIHGTSNRGERSGKTRLTAANIRAIRADTRLHRIIAAEYGITESGVSKIRSHDRWGYTA